MKSVWARNVTLRSSHKVRQRGRCQKTSVLGGVLQCYRSLCLQSKLPLNFNNTCFKKTHLQTFRSRQPTISPFQQLKLKRKAFLKAKGDTEQTLGGVCFKTFATVSDKQLLRSGRRAQGFCESESKQWKKVKSSRPRLELKIDLRALPHNTCIKKREVLWYLLSIRLGAISLT